MALASGRGGEGAARPEANASGEARSRLPPPGQLVLQDVREEDEGEHTIRDPRAPLNIRGTPGGGRALTPRVTS